MQGKSFIVYFEGIVKEGRFYFFCKFIDFMEEENSGGNCCSVVGENKQIYFQNLKERVNVFLLVSFILDGYFLVDINQV